MGNNNNEHFKIDEIPAISFATLLKCWNDGLLFEIFKNNTMNIKLKFDQIAKQYKRKQLAMNREPFYVPAFIERQSIDVEKLEAEKRHLQIFIF